MIGILPLPRVLAILSMTYALLVILAASIYAYWTGADQGLFAVASWAISGGTMLQLALLFIFTFGWKILWRWFPFLGNVIFPDLNGEWDIDVHWKYKDQQGIAVGTATVRQDFLSFSIMVRTDQSSSHTLALSVRKDPESKQPILYYFFRVEPEADSGPDGLPYRGAAMLRFFDDDHDNCIKGRYWTERPTAGRYVLRRRPKIRAY